MKCELVMKEYLQFDDYKLLPVMVKLHLLCCKKCRLEISSLENALDDIRSTDYYNMNKDMSDNIMHVIKSSRIPYVGNVPMFNWVSVGIVLISSLILVQFSDALRWLENQFGSNLEVPLNLALGLVISLYLIIFIGIHIEKIKNIMGNSFVTNDKLRALLKRY
jgi:hypothetical protein